MELVHEDVQYQVDAGFSRIVMWDNIKHNTPSKLKVSPLAVVPQTNRRGRLILDLSFPVHQRSQQSKRKLGQVIQAAVNDTTTPLAPEKPVNELGKVLLRIFDFMLEVPAGETINFSKIDLSDGFWRMVVEAEDAWNFAYVLPDPPGSPIRLVVPHALQMGWTQSPAFFCSATETTRDVLQVLVDTKADLPPHPFSHYMNPDSDRPTKRQRVGEHEFQMSSVFVDDFILAAVEDATGMKLQHTGLAALHAIHAIFPPPSISGHVGGKDPISVKKLKKGDAQWDPIKELLGFEVNGQRRTVRLPKSKTDPIVMELRRILKKRRVPLKRFLSLAGKLHHAATILPSARSLFTPLNHATRGDPKFISIGTKSELRSALLDFIPLIQSLHTRPTHVAELVKRGDNFIGYCDASAFGAGGVWFGGTCNLNPSVWRVIWPNDIRTAVVSESNPTGRLTNSDLEMAGVLIHMLVLETLAPLKHCRAVALCDNTPAVSWSTKLSCKAESSVAPRLLRGLAMRQRTLQSVPPNVGSIAGVDNKLADVASRAIPSLLDCDNPPHSHNMPTPAFIAFFNHKFPLPQHKSWTPARPSSEMLSNVISTLRGRRLPLQKWTSQPEPLHGKIGGNLPPRSAVTPTYELSQSHSSSRPSWALPLGLELESSGTKSKLADRASIPNSVSWRKPSFWLDTMIPDAPTGPRTSTCPSDTC
jgi:hypothetical protein